MPYGNPHKSKSKKKMSYSKKKPTKKRSMAKVGQRKAYRMTGRAKGN